MIFRILWLSFLFIVTFGGIFLLSFGFDIKEAFYEKTETIVAEHE